MRDREVTCKSDSQVVIGQIKGEFKVKEPLLQRYYHTVDNRTTRFQKVTVEHIHRHENKKVDAFSQLLATKKKSHHKFVMQIWLRQPSVAEAECLAVTETKAGMTPIVQYLEHDTCKSDEKKAMKQQCSRYTMINQYLYAGSMFKVHYSRSLLKCITKE